MYLMVTGGAGFIGSHFIDYILKKYPTYRIINIDKLTYAGNKTNLKLCGLNPNYVFYQCSITNKQEINRIMANNIDVVVNFAAESHVDRSIMDSSIFVETNVLGTQVLLESARQNEIKKFIQISTDEVYGSLGPTGHFHEGSPLAPNSPYSAIKASADLLVRAYHKTYGLPVNITRCSNNYGPYQFPEKLIPVMIIKALQDKPLPLYGDGNNIRDWLHVQDHCTAIDLVLHNGVSGEIYNIGGNNEWTNIDIVRAILKVLKKPESLIQHIFDRPGHDRRYAIDATKIRTQLGWSPKYRFSLGLEETIHWYVNHKDWWNNIHIDI